MVFSKYLLIKLRNIIIDGSFKKTIKLDDRQIKKEIIKKEKEKIKIKS